MRKEIDAMGELIHKQIDEHKKKLIPTKYVNIFG